MNITAPIRTLIAANAPAVALIGTRIYPGVLDQETAYPAAAVTMVSAAPTNSKTNASSLDRVSVQVDIYGSTYKSASDTAAALRTALDYQNTGVIGHIQFENQTDMFSEKPELNRIMQTYSIGYK